MSEWQPIETAPKDGANIFVASPEYLWPEVIRWENYTAEEAEEAGEPGYWRFSEDLLADVCTVSLEEFTRWMPMMAMPAE